MSKSDTRRWMKLLMTAENFGDVHDVLNLMAANLGFTLDGDFLHGWTGPDWDKVDPDNAKS